MQQPPSPPLDGSSTVDAGDVDAGAPNAAESVLVGRLLAEMTAAWQRGERPQVEDFLNREPELLSHPESVADLIYEEACLREQHGEAVSTEAILRRFPQWRAELELLLDCRQLFESERANRSDGFGRAGERFGEFNLVAELGRGGAGVVFLATQPSLGDRPVVLKLTRCDGREHLRLARLQHTHIVPLYFVQDDPRRQLRALCMPYYGGVSLARILTTLDAIAVERRSGKDLVDALDRAQAGTPVTFMPRAAARDVLARASYIQAVCWIGSCLANALQYAHENGMVHLDLKPSNVLLTADCQPMLLDFHLARAPATAGTLMADGMGGTPDYMSPEQDAALTAVRAGQPIPAAVDARSDVYSLGVLLFKALGGSLPLTPSGIRLLPRRNPAISTGLVDILNRCLAPGPNDRYRDAAAIATDLQCHLKDLPLRGVGNRSMLERWRKWRRRRPYAAPFGLALLLAVAMGLIGGAGFINWNARQGRESLAQGKALLHQRRFAEAIDTFERGIRLADSVPFHADLAQILREHLDLAERARAADELARCVSELHRLADRIRMIVDINSVPGETRAALERSCRALWERRAQLGSLSSADAPESAAKARQDLVEIAIFWSDLRMTMASADNPAIRHDVLRVLAEADEQFGASPLLLHRVEAHARAKGLLQLAELAAARRASFVPRTATEHLALGRCLLDVRDAERAAIHFAIALEMQPENLWPHFYLGTCSYKLGKFREAVVSFSVCIGLAPHSAPCWYNRARAFEGCGQTAESLRDFTRAAQLDPTLVKE